MEKTYKIFSPTTFGTNFDFPSHAVSRRGGLSVAAETFRVHFGIFDNFCNFCNFEKWGFGYFLFSPLVTDDPWLSPPLGEDKCI